MNRKLFILMAAASIFAQAMILAAAGTCNVKTITSVDELDNYTANSAKPVVANFTIEQCKYCKEMAPHLDKVKKDFADKFNFVEIDGENFAGLEEFNLEGYPTLIVFKNGNEAFRFHGGTEAEIKAELRSAE